MTSTNETHTAWLTIGHSTTTPTHWTTSLTTEETWPVRFDADIRDLLDRFGATIITEAVTIGEWEGVPEVGRAFLFTINAGEFTIARLRGALQVFAWKYGQQAIGLVGTFGGETLVVPEP